jgi:hypothetical protein
MSATYSSQCGLSARKRINGWTYARGTALGAEGGAQAPSAPPKYATGVAVARRR